jgi:hypothetical protein
MATTTKTGMERKRGRARKKKRMTVLKTLARTAVTMRIGWTTQLSGTGPVAVEGGRLIDRAGVQPPPESSAAAAARAAFRWTTASADTKTGAGMRAETTMILGPPCCGMTQLDVAG